MRRRRELRCVASALVAGVALFATASCTSAPAAQTGLSNDQLLAAAWANDVPTATRLIKAGADVNHVGATT